MTLSCSDVPPLGRLTVQSRGLPAECGVRPCCQNPMQHDLRRVFQPNAGSRLQTPPTATHRNKHEEVLFPHQTLHRVSLLGEDSIFFGFLTGGPEGLRLMRSFPGFSFLEMMGCTCWVTKGRQGF